MPNNTLATATYLNTNTSLAPLTDQVSTAGGDDYYRLQLAGRSSVALSLTGLSANANVQLLNGTGSVVTQSTNGGTLAESVNQADLVAGTYYVRVFTETATATYTLNLQAQNDVEPVIVWRDYATGDNRIWKLDGTTTVSNSPAQAVVSPNWHIDGVGDFNRDGIADLVWRHDSTGENALWLMNSAGQRSTLVNLRTVPSANWKIQGTGDFTNDGDTDILWHNDATGENIIWKMQGTTEVQTLAIQTTALTPTNVAAPWQMQGSGDFNQDGQVDILWRNYSTGENVVWMMQGVTRQSVVNLPTVPSPAWQMQGTGDFNKDNQADILWRNYSTGETVVWMMNGTTRTQIVSIPTVGPGSWQIEGVGNHYLTPPRLDEAGNTTATAFNVGTLNANGAYAGFIGPQDGTDYYRFSLTQASVFGVRLEGLSADLTIDLIDLVANATWRAPQAGNSSEQFQQALNPGTYYVQVKGATSAVTSGYGLKLFFDAAPPAPSGLALVNGTPTNATNDTTPTITGQAATGSAVTLVFETGQPVGTTTAGSNGSWSITTSELTEGTHSLKAISTNGEGFYSTASVPLSVIITLDISAPILSAELAVDTAIGGTTNVDGVTANPTIVGQVTSTHQIVALRAGFTTAMGVTYRDITAQLQPGGSFTLNRTQLAALYGGPLLDAHYTLLLRAEDTLGNVTAPWTVAFVLDTQAPTAPSNLSLTPAGKYAVAISGNAEVGAQVQLFEGTNWVGEAVANATGSWRMTTSQLRNGSHSLTTTASDAAGNTSPTTTATPLVVESLVPTAPQGLRLTALTDSGQSQLDNITSDTTPTVMGTTEAGATVRLFQEQQLLGETIADLSGAWQIELATALPQGEQTLSVVAHNPIGASQATTFTTTIDSVAPSTAQLSFLAAGSSTPTALVNGATLMTGTRLLGQVDGTVSAIASLQYQLGTGSAVIIPVAANGLFNYRLDLTGSSSGTQLLTLSMTDIAGNTTTLAPFTVNINGASNNAVETPFLLAQLTQDTGTDTTDGWTFVPGIAGVVSAQGQITALLATFDPATNAPLQDLTSLLKADGTFALDVDQL